MAEETTAPPPSLTDARGWLGAKVTEINGSEVGEVQGFFVDEESQDPVWLLARLGRRRSRVVAVPLGGCAGAPFGVWVAQEGEKLASAPVVDPTRPLLREHELTICSHYGIGPAVGRAAAVSPRAEGAVTSGPPSG